MNKARADGSNIDSAKPLESPWLTPREAELLLWITTFTADVLADNHAMIQVFHKVFAKIESKLEAGVHHLRCDLAVTKKGRKGAQ